MNLGENLSTARKNCGMTQEDVAAKLGVSRQTISKWETDETLPDIRQAKSLANLYRLSLDELIDFDADVTEIRQVIQNTSQETQEKIDWTKLWGEKYPVLTTYQQQVDTKAYAARLQELLRDLESTYHYSPLDAMLVLKDILGHTWENKTQ